MSNGIILIKGKDMRLYSSNTGRLEDLFHQKSLIGRGLELCGRHFVAKGCNVLYSLLLLLCVVISTPVSHAGQPVNNLAIKTNLLYDATTTPNLGVEFGVGRKNTFQVFYGLNPWTFDTGSGIRKAKHWVVMPELRWWTCSRFNGHFFGIHLMGGQYNAGNVDLLLPGLFFAGNDLAKDVRTMRCQGWFGGGGVTYGYQWILGRHWNIEAEIGVGYDHVWYDRYPCYECGAQIATGETNYAGVTKLGVSILYIF